MQEPTHDSNWVKARSSIAWIAALLVAFGAVWWIEQQTGKELIARQQPARSVVTVPASADLPAMPAPRALTAQERQWAQVAWTYFERNTDATTGLTGAVDGYPSASLWDLGSGLMALLAARELGLLDQKAFDERMARALASLGRLPLPEGALPNKSYDTRTLAMTDYRNQPAPGGIGWSALDIGRIAVPLHLLVWQHPQHTAAVRRVLARWDLAQLSRAGQLWGQQAGDGAAPQPVQEGRLGYEQYAARALALVGLDAPVAANAVTHLKLVDVEGVAVPADDREAHNWVTSEPWILQGLELGWTPTARELAWRVYRAQEERFRHSGTLTAVTEDHVDRPPYFVYNAVYVGGKRWMAVSDKGEPVPQLRTLSTKAAFGWHALLPTPYTTRLVEAVAGLADPARGWAAGLYEEGGRPNTSVNANTNAVVLESLAATVRGPFLQIR